MHMEPKQHFICFSSEFCAKKFYASLKSPEVTNSTQQLGSFLYFFCFFFFNWAHFYCYDKVPERNDLKGQMVHFGS